MTTRGTKPGTWIGVGVSLALALSGCGGGHSKTGAGGSASQSAPPAPLHVVSVTPAHLTGTDPIVGSFRSPLPKNSTLPTLEKFKTLLATGHVVIVQGDREATCGRAEVLPHEDRVVLTQNPVVVDHGADLTNTGDEIILDHHDRRVIVNKAHVVGPTIKDLGFEQAKPVPPAADAAPKPEPPK